MEEQACIESSLVVPLSKNKLKDFLRDLPKNPGVYKFLDESKKVIYIGKAKNLRNRIPSYFANSSNKTKKLKKLVYLLKSIEITITNSELEALLLEQYLIKEKKPKFNVQFKDDKGFPRIKIESSKEFPSAKPFLGKMNSQDKFYGPFPSSYAVQESLRSLQKIFKLRNCSDSFFKNRTRPCIQYEIGRCSAPCLGYISKKEYMKEVDSASLLLLGKSEELTSSFYSLMDKHSKAKSFEKAAIYRDKISSLRDIQRLQSVTGHSQERDAVSICTINGETKVGITHVNGGWVTGHENFITQNNIVEGSLLRNFIQTYYLSEVYCPKNIIVGEAIQNKEMIELALSEYHNKKVRVISKLATKDKGLMKICEDNTRLSFHKAGIKHRAIPALDSLQEELSLTKKIDLIESYDISHHSGSAAVAGCVVYSKNGKEKNRYRLFNISKENSGNDIASMVEVVKRRFTDTNLDKEIPSLIIIDGGKVHLSHVTQELKRLGLKEISVISISKGVRRKLEMDSIHKQDDSSIKVSKGSLAHKFIQEIRDETHRFSITMQKKKQTKLSTASALDSLEGVGPKRKKLLIRYFGSVEQIKRASIIDLINIPGLGKKTAKSIYNQLK
tara:strand:+ start:4137 stop:5978 length:1842 start_codon:yes stop_codon:yes gene_type:complete